MKMIGRYGCGWCNTNLRERNAQRCMTCCVTNRTTKRKEARRWRKEARDCT